MIDGIPGWVVACTAVCGGILLLCLSLLGGGVFYVGGVIGEFEEADKGLERLECITGAPSDFHPDPTGAIPAERIEAFLSARSGFSDMTARLGLILRDLGPDAGIFHKIPAGFRLPRELARYVIHRNEAIGATGIGLGEYYYIYTLAYHSWLGKPLSDGPAFILVSDDGYILEDVSEDLSADLAWVATPRVFPDCISAVRAHIRAAT